MSNFCLCKAPLRHSVRLNCTQILADQVVKHHLCTFPQGFLIAFSSHLLLPPPYASSSPSSSSSLSSPSPEEALSCLCKLSIASCLSKVVYLLARKKLKTKGILPLFLLVFSFSFCSLLFLLKMPARALAEIYILKTVCS